MAQASASPNYGPRRDGARPSLIILHYTGMPSCAEALARLCDPAAEVSAHYLIGEAGAVAVEEDLRVIGHDVVGGLQRRIPVITGENLVGALPRLHDGDVA